MAKKTDNEITVKLKCDTKELGRRLLDGGYRTTKHFILDDYYYIPSGLNLKNMSIREIISSAVLVRDIVNDTQNRHDKKLTYKVKDINEAGEILSQTAYDCDVVDVPSAMSFIEAIGYKLLMEIKEEDYEYTGEDGFQIATKDIEDGDDLIEIETTDDERYNTVEKLVAKLNQSGIPFYDDDYFVKKAEVELRKIFDEKKK